MNGRCALCRVVMFLFVFLATSTAGIAQTAHPHPFTTVPLHVTTADYLGFKTANFSWTAAAPYLDWANVPQSVEQQVQAAGIKTMLYTDPNRSKPGQPLYTSDEATFAHACDGSRIWVTADTFEDLMNPESVDLHKLWLRYVQSVESTDHYDAVFEDDANDVAQISSLPCHYDPATWLNNSLVEDTYMKNHGVNLIYNGLAIFGQNLTVSPSIALNAAATGGMMEQCYVRPGTTNYQVAGAVWKTIENTAIQMAKASRFFYCYANTWSFTDSHAISLREYVDASFLLTYDPATSILWETFPTQSGFHVNPETQLVPLSPKHPSPSSIDDLRMQNVYAQEYGACYIHGRSVGPCAVVVNPNYVAYAWPFAPATYTHTLVIGGADLLEGGWVRRDGPAPATSMPAISATIAFQ